MPAGFVSGAGVHQGKLRQLSVPDQFEVFPHGSFHRTKCIDSMRIFLVGNIDDAVKELSILLNVDNFP